MIWGVWLVIAVVLSVVSFGCAVWFYFDPDRVFRRDEKRQRLLVRKFLLGVFAAPVWPLALVGFVGYGLWKLVSFAFPRGTVEE